MRSSLFIIWLLLCIAALVYTLAAPQAEFTVIGHLLLMGLLTFPSGLVAYYTVVFVFSSVLEVGGIAFYIVTWCIMVAIGYYQWFILVPSLVSKIRGRNA